MSNTNKGGNVKGGNVNINIGDKEKQGYYVGSASNMARLFILISLVFGLLVGYIIAKQNSINQVGANVSNGISSLGYQTLDLASRNGLATQQGFNQIGRDMCTSSSAIVSAVNGVGSQLAECCCATQRLVEREACATRELIQALNTQNIRDQLCDAKSKISTLESNAFTAGALNNAVATIIKHIPTTTTTA